MPNHPNDAHLWAELCGLFRAGGMGAAERTRLARCAVAIVRRERAAAKARTFAPGDGISYDVVRAYDLDGDVWERQGQPPDSLKDTWKMPGFDPERYGPLTELPRRLADG